MDDEMKQLTNSHLAALAKLEDAYHSQVDAENHDYQQHTYEIVEKRVPGSSKWRKQRDDVENLMSQEMRAISLEQRKEIGALPQTATREIRAAIYEKYTLQRDAAKAKWRGKLQELGLVLPGAATPRPPARPKPKLKPKK